MEPKIVKIKGSRGESWSSKFWRDVALRTLNETRPYRGAVNKQLANNGCDNDEHKNNKKNGECFMILMRVEMNEAEIKERQKLREQID